MKYPSQMNNVELIDALSSYGLTQYLSGLKLPYDVWRGMAQNILRKAQLGDVDGALEDAKAIRLEILGKEEVILTIAERQKIEIRLMARYHGYEDVEKFLSLVLDDGIDFYLMFFEEDHPEEYQKLMSEWPPSERRESKVMERIKEETLKSLREEAP